MPVLPDNQAIVAGRARGFKLFFGKIRTDAHSAADASQTAHYMLRGVSIEIAFTKRIGAGLFGGEGFILQKLTGDGLVFVHAGGTLHHRRLGPGELLRVDTGCIVAFQSSIEYDIKFVGGFKNTLFGGEGLFFAVLTGPGDLWLQSLPFARLADRIHATARGTTKRRGEGSLLGGLGNLLDGDNKF